MFNAGKSQNAASEQNCNVYWSKVSIQPIPKLMCVIYSTVVPLNACPCGLVWLPCFALLRFAGVPLLCCFVLLPSFLLCLATVQILDLNWFAALSWLVALHFLFCFCSSYPALLPCLTLLPCLFTFPCLALLSCPIAGPVCLIMLPLHSCLTFDCLCLPFWVCCSVLFRFHQTLQSFSFGLLPICTSVVQFTSWDWFPSIKHIHRINYTDCNEDCWLFDIITLS